MAGENISSSEATEMPDPPDLSQLFNRQTDQINAACRQATQMFSALSQKDTQVQKLSAILAAEVEQVQALAAAAKTPDLAAAAAPAVIAAATAAFSQVPATDQACQRLIQTAFKPIRE